MLNEKSFSLILGCGGFRYSNIIFCSGTTNIIINFEKHYDHMDKDKIMNFLDYTCGLFDGPVGEWNKLTNIIQLLYSRYGLINDELKAALYSWLAQHKRCGGYLKLVLNADLDKYIINDESFIIPYSLRD